MQFVLRPTNTVDAAPSAIPQTSRLDGRGARGPVGVMWGERRSSGCGLEPTPPHSRCDEARHVAACECPVWRMSAINFADCSEVDGLLVRLTMNRRLAAAALIAIAGVALITGLIWGIGSSAGSPSLRDRHVSAGSRTDPTLHVAPPASVLTDGSVQDSDVELRASVERIVAQITRRFHDDLVRHPAYARFLSCERQRAACSGLYDDALSAVFWSNAQQLTLDEFHVGSLIAEHGEVRVHELFAEIYVRSSEDVERLATLAVLDRVPSLALAPRELPAPAYDRIRERPAIEGVLLLTRHNVVPITSASSARVAADVAIDGTLSGGLRYAAITSLGHVETAPQLVSITRRFARDGALSGGVAARLGPALGRCGGACSPAIELLLTSGVSDDRRIAYSSMAQMAPDDRAAMVTRMRSLASAPDEMTPDEQIDRNRMLDLAGN